MQKTDPIREHAHAKASAQPTPALARLKARSYGKQPEPVAGAARPVAQQPGPRQKPIVW